MNTETYSIRILRAHDFMIVVGQTGIKTPCAWSIDGVNTDIMSPVLMQGLFCETLYRAKSK